MSGIEHMERKVTLRRRRPLRYTPITNASIMDEIAILAGREAQNWREQMNALRSSGVPMALQGPVTGLAVNPPPDALSAVTFSASEQALWPATTWTPMTANLQAPAHFELFASGTITTVTSPGTMTLTPRWGTSVSGATLGASNAVTLTASVTAVPWQLYGEVTVRGAGTGTNARVYGTFQFLGKLAAAGNGAADQNLLFGYTAATGDSSGAQGLFMGLTGSTTTPTITVQQIKWGLWN